MTLNLPGGAVSDPATDQNLRAIAQAFPVRELAEEAKESLVEGSESLRIVRGIINTTSPGSIVEGEGFTIKRNGTGDVTVTFSPSFGGPPAVTLAANSPGVVGAVLHSGLVVTASQFRMVGLNGSFAGADSLIHFIAAGPR